MGYNIEGAKEGSTLPADLILDGVITDIKDGVVKDFVTSPDALKKWKRPDGKVIQVFASGQHEGKTFETHKLFTYSNDAEGKTVYTGRSDLGKFFAKYKALPKLEGRVKLITNADGFLRIKMD